MSVPLYCRPEGTWTYQYYGPDKANDCGVMLANVSRYDNGFWTVTAGGIATQIFVEVLGMLRLEN